MAFEADNRGRVGQSTYWMFFGGYVVGSLLLLIGGIAELFSGAWLIGMLCILVLLPVGLYFRVIVMRRCRDIGWPASLPWILFGLQMVAALFFRPSHVSGQSAALMLLGPPALLGLVDFVFTIAVGCIPTKSRSWEAFHDGFDPRDLPQAPRGYLDSVVQARPKASRVPRGIDEPAPGPAPQFGARPSQTHTPATPLAAPTGPRPNGGFGRRVV